MTACVCVIVETLTISLFFLFRKTVSPPLSTSLINSTALYNGNKIYYYTKLCLNKGVKNLSNRYKQNPKYLQNTLQEINQCGERFNSCLPDSTFVVIFDFRAPYSLYI